jgi:hypothetical protein
MSFNAGNQWNSTLKRRVSLRDSYRFNKRTGGTRAVVSHNGLSRTRLKKMSKGHRAELAKYRKLETKFLSDPVNKWCICCTIRREHGENICRNQATEIHHWAGRIGRLLCYVPYFRAFCNRCRTWPHDYPKLARELGLLAPANLWNAFPINGTNRN